MFKIIVFLFFFVSSALADINEFGGHDVEFKGDGDKVPPQCQIDLPSGTTTNFSVRWNCADDTAPDHEIRTELWLLRNGAGHAIKIGDFLGFPAAVNIDETVLGSTTVASGLPAAFRLVAIDRAGIASISPYYTVYPQNNSIKTCSLVINRAATESTESSTGSPATSLSLNKVSVNVTPSSTSSFTVATTSNEIASPCDISTICDETDDGQVSFTASLDSSAGTINVSPGNFQASLTGVASSADGVSMTGTGSIDGVSAEVSLSCTD